MNIMKVKILGFACAVVALAGCGAKPQSNYVKMHGFALGTEYNVTANLADTVGLRRGLDSLFAAATASMSVYDHGSLLNRLNRNETDVTDRHVEYCIGVAARVSEISGGVYDITLKPLSEAWGFNGGEPQENPNVDSLLRYVGYRKIHIEDGRLTKDDPAVRIDLNSVAKGYTVELAAEYLVQRGAADYLVEVGGEVACRGVNPSGAAWRIAIDRPFDGNYAPGEVRQGTIALTDEALATSGNYRRFYTDAEGRKVVHTIDATTGQSRPTDLLSATVVAADCTTADAWATMLMAVGTARARQLLEEHPEVGGYLIYTNNTGKYETYISPQLESKIVN